MTESYFFGETAFHHQGDLDYILKLVDAIAGTRCQGIKFQLLTEISDFVSSKHSAFDQLSEYCFSEEHWRKIIESAKSADLDIIAMPLNEGAVHLVSEYNPRMVEIHSVSFNDKSLFEAVRDGDFQVLLGVGGRTLEEIASTIDFFGGQVRALMVGFQSFPSQLADVGIGKIKLLKEMFPQIEVGYADHSGYDDPMTYAAHEYARILGATIFEKHITLEEGVKRVDFESAVGTSRMDEIISRVKFVERNILLKPQNLLFNEKEQAYRERQLKVVAKEDLKAGHRLLEQDLTLKMIDSHDGNSSIEDLVGSVLLNDIEADQIVIQRDLMKERQ